MEEVVADVNVRLAVSIHISKGNRKPPVSRFFVERSSILRGNKESLELDVGDDVWVAVKATEISLQPA